MNMDLTIRDRLLLLIILPKEGNVKRLRIQRGLRERLSFSEEENEKFKIKFNSGTGAAAHDEDAEKEHGPFKFTFNREERKLLSKQLKQVCKRLNTMERLTDGHLDVVRKFLTVEEFDTFTDELEKDVERMETKKREAEKAAKEKAEKDAEKKAEAEKKRGGDEAEDGSGSGARASEPAETESPAEQD